MTMRLDSRLSRAETAMRPGPGRATMADLLSGNYQRRIDAGENLVLESGLAEYLAERSKRLPDVGEQF